MTPNARSGTAAALTAVLAFAACGGDSTGPPPPPLEITTESLPDGSLDAAYTAGINADGGDQEYEWSISAGTLPPGLALSIEDLPDGDDVVITGQPTTTGNFSFTVRVESGDGQFDTRQFAVQVRATAELLIDNLVLPPALVGGPYDVRLRASGTAASGDLSWTLAGGTLPPGLTLTEAGRLHGTPTATDTVGVTVQVTAGGSVKTRSYSLRVVANDEARYNLTPVPVAPIPAEIQPHVDAALAQWEDVLTGDLVGVAVGPFDVQPSNCGGFGDAIGGTSIDDILVLINIAEIDGPGKVLGQAGPCFTRLSDTLTVAGILTLDSEDLLPLVGTETLTHILAHEIGHILGFGSLWDGLLTGEDTSNPRFTGSQAVAEWHALGGEGDVPVEGTGGQGTAGSHWRESVFGHELMTGFSAPVGVFQPLSRVTIGSMEDLGYQVNYGAADAYTLGLSLLGVDAYGNHLGRDIVLDLPVRFIDDTRNPIPPRTRSLEGAP